MTAHWPVAAGGGVLVKLEARKRGQCCQNGHGVGNRPMAGDRNQTCRERFNGGVTLPLFREAKGVADAVSVVWSGTGLAKQAKSGGKNISRNDFLIDVTGRKVVISNSSGNYNNLPVFH